VSEDANNLIAACAKALETARPYVLDGRGGDEIDRALASVDDAIERAARYRDDDPPK
jgi:hypothetical protein